MEKQDLESVQLNLRSVTQSCKGGVPLDRLERDYRDLLGSRVPYRDLGYNSLEAFVRSIPDVIVLKKGRDGQLMAEAVADSTTAHIASLVSRQKQPKTIVRGSRRPYFRRGGFSTRYTPRGGRGSYSSYNSTPIQPSGRTYKRDVKPPTLHHSRPSQSSPTLSTTIHVARVKSTVVSAPRFAAVAPTPSLASVETSKTKSVSLRGYEIAPRFLRLYQRKVEAEQKRISPRNSPTPPRNSPTPPRTSPVETLPSIAPPSARTFRVTDNSSIPAAANVVSPGELYATTFVTKPPSVSVLQERENGYSFNMQRSPRPLLPRKNLVRIDKKLEAAQTSKEYIEIYARINKISVKYSTKNIGQKKRNQGFVSNLYLGENKYLSYPEVASTEEEAEEIAAQVAVEKIKESQALPETSISNADEIQTLLTRIEELVCEKPSGMFTNGIVHEYEHKFYEALPDCWLDLLRQSSVVDIEEIDVPYGRIPDGANFIVRPAKGLSSGSTTPSEASTGKLHSELQDFENEESIPKHKLINHTFPPVPPLMIPAGNEWGVCVTNTLNCVAARLIDYDDDFLALSKMMSTFYDSQILPVHEVFEKQLYTTIGDRVNGVLVMHRVLANRILDDYLVECYYVDDGVFDNVKKSDLQELCEEFLSFPYQAIHFALDDLEEYEPFMTAQHLEPLKFGTYIAQVKRCCSPIDDFLPDDPAIHRVLYSVKLYDTSDTENDVCLNDTIKESVLQSLACKLPKLNVSSRGYLTHVTDLGEIYLRFLHPEGSWLEVELERLSAGFEETCIETPAISPGKICAAKYEDEKWYRAVFKNSIAQDPEMVEVFFIDYGHPSVVKRSDICDLQPHSEFLSILGHQAIKCELYNALPSPDSTWTVSATQKLVEMAPFHEELIVRVISEGNQGVLSKVNLHKRIYLEKDSLIISINDNLANRPELFLDLSVPPTNGGIKVPSKLNLQYKTTQLPLSNYVPSITSPIEKSVFNSFKKIDVASPINDGIEWVMTPDNVKSPEEEDLSPAPLTPPQVPAKGEIFDVYVTLAATPHNFVVQPFKSAPAMNDLMSQMHQFYSVEENFIEMHPSLLKKNCYYAALHPDDGEWYRVRLVSSNTSEPIMAAVYYVDFGDFNTVRLQNLQKLYKQFRDLPCQAIKASLSAVKPIEIDWDPVHCVKFKELVTEKKFVSVVQKKCLKEEQDFSSVEVELTLIDTNDPNKDVYIHELLIDRLMAVPTAI